MPGARSPTAPTTTRASARCSTRRTSRSSSGSYGAAWTCADRAADLAPTSVEAHHLRGAALAALGRDAEAQTAYSLALALDPDDPETLRAVADFYINGKGERGRDALRLGLELAQRGSRRALARRRRNAPLAADLAVLEAQALNDLGRSDEALERDRCRAADRARAAATRCTRRASRCSTCRGSPTPRPRSQKALDDPARRRVHAPDARAHARAARRDPAADAELAARGRARARPSCRRRC